MDAPILFRTARLSGCAPRGAAAPLYAALFGTEGGANRLAADMLDWSRHGVAPWTLSHAGRAIGVAGFRIGFGGTGLDLSFHFLPDVAGQGLASEFVQAALDHGTKTLCEDRFFARVEADNAASIRILEKAGFRRAVDDGGAHVMQLTITTPAQASEPRHPAASA